LGASVVASGKQLTRHSKKAGGLSALPAFLLRSCLAHLQVPPLGIVVFSFVPVIKASFYSRKLLSNFNFYFNFSGFCIFMLTLIRYLFLFSFEIDFRLFP